MLTLQQQYEQLRRDEQSANLPKPLSERSGCKVSWAVYATQEEANKRAVFARRKADLDAELGYEFGYLTPGTVTQLTDGTWEVVLP